MTEATRDNTWADLMADGRLPRFALICLGVWLNAADSLVTATIMPSVGAQLGGYAYFSWATAGFLVGAILAGASSGRVSEIFGLRGATAMAGVIMTLGCVMSALAPDVATFLAGRLIQGLGSGWISGFAMVAIALLFPERHWARVFASVTFIWGIATVLGPLFGGAVLEGGTWRDVFWLFALQAGVFSAAAPLLLRGASKAGGGPGVPWLQLAVLGVGVAAIAVADVVKAPALAVGLVVVGLAILTLVIWIDHRWRRCGCSAAAIEARTQGPSAARAISRHVLRLTCGHYGFRDLRSAAVAEPFAGSRRWRPATPSGRNRRPGPWRRCWWPARRGCGTGAGSASGRRS